MKQLFLIAYWLIVSCLVVNAQELLDDCGKYDYYVSKGDSAMRAAKPDYRLAIQAFRAARDCKPAKAYEVDKKLDNAFTRINNERIKADRQARALREEKRINQNSQQKIESQANALVAKDSLRYNPVKSFKRAADAYHKHPSALTMGVLMEAYQMHQYTRDSTLDKTITVLTASPFQNKIALAKEGSNNVYICDSLSEKSREPLYGHEGVIQHLAFSPDGRYLASAADDRTIKIWTSEGQFVRTLRNEPSIVKGMAFTPDGKSIITGSKDGIIRLLSVQGDSVEEKKNPAILNIDFFTVSQKGPMLVVGSDQKLLYGSSAGNLKPVDDFPADGRVLATGLSPDGRSFVVSDSKLKVYIFNEHGGIKEQFQVKSYVVGTYFLNDRDIALATADGPILLYQNEQSADLTSLIAHQGAVTAMCRIGINLWSTGRDKTLKRWNYTRHRDPYTFIAKSYALSNEEHLHTQTDSPFELISNGTEITISRRGNPSTIFFYRERLKRPRDIYKEDNLIAWHDPTENKIVLSQLIQVTNNSGVIINHPGDPIISWPLQEKGECHVAFSEDGNYLLVEIIPTLNATNNTYGTNTNTYEDQVKLLLYPTPAMVYKLAYPQNQLSVSKSVSKHRP